MLFVLIFLSFSSAFGSAKNLEIQKIYFGQEALDLSGSVKVDDNFFMVADKPENHFIYKVIFKDKRFVLDRYLNFKDIPGYEEYQKNAFWTDMEGITYCAGDFYLIDEQIRQVIKVNKKEFKKLPIHFPKDFLEGKKNFGFEGIAIDCRNRKLYVAKEMFTRRIAKIDLNTYKIVFYGEVPVGRGSQLSQDVAALHYENGFLYMVARNERKVYKLDSSNLKPLASVSYLEDTKDLYTTGYPYGMGESLTLTKDQIILGLDNNRNPMTKSAEKKYGFSGNFPSLLLFKRPEGF